LVVADWDEVPGGDCRAHLGDCSGEALAARDRRGFEIVPSQFCIEHGLRAKDSEFGRMRHEFVFDAEGPILKSMSLV
jgi:hypothetical protein